MKKISCFKPVFATLVAGMTLTGCQTIKTWQPNAGPTMLEVEKSTTDYNNINDIQGINATNGTVNGLTIIDIDGRTVNRANQISVPRKFSDYFHGGVANDYRIRAGDVLTISMWEAPPALLFGSAGDINTLSGSKEVKLPEQMVDTQGQISVPFLGKLNVLGKSPQQVQDAIMKGLARKANQLNAIVGIGKNNSSNITVVGEVNNSLRVPLTGKGERLLDAIAAAGGSKYPSGKVTVQLNRNGRTIDMPLDAIINDARQNVVLQAGDVVSVNYQSKSFTVLGATIKNDEVNFESNGISLMQALARSGGLNDNRADSRGVFVFRYETPEMLTVDQISRVPSEYIRVGRVPVVYRLNLKDPMNYILAQHFPIKNQDVVYVSNAPATEFAKFLNMISQGIFSITGIKGL